MFTNSPRLLTFCPLQKTTCPDWTIYSWQGFNSIGCPLTLTTNYRCVQSTQHQCWRRQMCGKRSQIHPVHSIFVCYKILLVLTEQSIHGKFQLISMSSYSKNKLQMCSVTQHQCRRRQMCGKCSQIHPVHSLLSVTKNDLSWLNNLFMARFQLISMSSYVKNKL